MFSIAFLPHLKYEDAIQSFDAQICSGVLEEGGGGLVAQGASLVG